jgi:flagellar P-ring protein FlgI
VRAIFTLLLLLLTFPAVAQVRIKDIADIEGVRDNQLIGYGLVVGLNNTGDKLSNAIFTRDTLVNMLQRLEVNTQDQTNQLQTKNIAAVIVTADWVVLSRNFKQLL